MAFGKEQKETWIGLIKIKGLKTSYAYGKAFTVDELCFERSKVTSVIGKNGCGKSTLLKTIAGMMPYEGSIKIGDSECSKLRPRERAKKLAYLPQLIKPVNLDVQTLAEHGRYPWHGNNRRLSDEDKALVEEALKLTGMSDYHDRELTELSGGQLRRAYLSMVIAQDADIILLDEPTTFMDIESQALFYEIAAKLADKGCGVIQTCHNIEQAFSYSDFIVMMGDRCIKKTGTPKELSAVADDFRDTFGAAVKEADDKDSLYKYVLVK